MNRDPVINTLEAAKKAFQIAEEAYTAQFGKTAEMSAIGPMAAQIYRQLTQIVVVTVDDVQAPEMRRIGEILQKEGYKGIITSGGVTYHFPDHGPIGVNIKTKESGCRNDCVEKEGGEK